MTSFGWKRKHGLRNATNKAFRIDDETSEGFENNDEHVDWLANAKRSKVLLLESAEIKSQRLKDEGTTLAEAERYWEALKKWHEALRLTPNDYKIHEMKAQAYMALHEVFPAVQAAEIAVQRKPNWWVAYQTLGRAQLGLGEVDKAIRSFCKAAHIQPDIKELWDEDISWARSLLSQHQRIQTEVELENLKKERQGATIVELDVEETNSGADDNSNDDDEISYKQVVPSTSISQMNYKKKTNFKISDSWIKMKPK